MSAKRISDVQSPSDDRAARQAVPRAVQQSDFMIAVAGADPSLWHDKVGCPSVGSPLASGAGMEVIASPHDLEAERALKASGQASRC